MNFEQLLDSAPTLGIPQKFIEIWIPKDKFVSAFLNEDSLSITRIDEPYFGFGFGPNPVIDPRWNSFTISRATPKEVTGQFELVGQWDAYGIATKPYDISYQVLTDLDLINNLIEKSAPELSIRAEDPEVLAWVGIDEMAAGAICKWESGGSVLSAIVVAENFRGQGLGKKITQALISEAHKRGIDYVALGVMAKNEAAISTYKSVGFQELGKFNTFKN
ncbi:MAG: GNAT family N-acetyltransferase [Candidatus Nanopelagicaceae bacterium]